MKREDDEDGYFKKLKLLEKINEQIEEDKRLQKAERERYNKLAEELVKGIIQLIIGSVVIGIMIYAIYKCIKKNEEFYRQQGKQRTRSTNFVGHSV